MIPTLAHYSEISSGSNTYIYIFWHYIWHSFWHILWHSIWHSGILSGMCSGPLMARPTSWQRWGQAVGGEGEGRKEGRSCTWLVGKKTTSNIIIILGCSPWTKHLNAVKLIFLHGPPCQILPAPADSHRQWCGEPWGSRGSRGCRGLFSGSSQDVVI